MSAGQTRACSSAGSRRPRHRLRLLVAAGRDRRIAGRAVPQPASERCRVDGRVTSGALPQTRTANAGAAPAGGAAATGRGGQRFQRLAVQGDANATTEPDAAAPPDERELASLVPPGFAAESAQADAIAVNGSASATN